jgi:hypothetical protein
MHPFQPPQPMPERESKALVTAYKTDIVSVGGSGGSCCVDCWISLCCPSLSGDMHRRSEAGKNRDWNAPKVSSYMPGIHGGSVLNGRTRGQNVTQSVPPATSYLCATVPNTFKCFHFHSLSRTFVGGGCFSEPSRWSEQLQAARLPVEIRTKSR